jgi:hypothetical protein
MNLLALSISSCPSSLPSSPKENYTGDLGKYSKHTSKGVFLVDEYMA